MLHYKEYASYEDYLADQVEKLNLREDYVRQKSRRKYFDFCADFACFENYLDKGCKILCLGARFGEEVRAFRALGYDAIGIDLWGAEGDLVIKGDWNDLPFENELDVIYTNSIDHAWSVDMLVGQIKKALKPAGKVIIALDQNHTHGANNKKIKAKLDNPDRYEAVLWNSDEDITNAFEHYGFNLATRWIRRRWHTYLMER